MKKRLLFLGVACALCLGGCGKSDVTEYEPATSEETSVTTTQTATTEEVTTVDENSTDEGTTEAQEQKVETGIFATDMNNNVASGVSLNKLTVDGIETTIPCSIESTGLTRCSFANSNIQTSYEFSGWGYGIQSDEEDPLSYDSIIFFQVNEANTQVLGARISSSFVNNNTPSYSVGGIRVGMSEADVIGLYGSGKEHAGNYFYKNDSGVLIVEYENSVVESVTYLPE